MIFWSYSDFQMISPLYGILSFYGLFSEQPRTKINHLEATHFNQVWILSETSVDVVLTICKSSLDLITAATMSLFFELAGM